MSQAEKWNLIYSKKECSQEIPCEVLSQNMHLLPLSGNALDLASGLGANAILLAQKKFHTEAWDISSTAMNKLTQYAQLNQLDIRTLVKDVEKHPPEKNTFDVICVANFLHRESFPQLIDGLTHKGLLFYQTFIAEKTFEVGPKNPAFLLKKNELIRLCQGMDILVYREEGVQGYTQQGWRNQAMIVARKS